MLNVLQNTFKKNNLPIILFICLVSIAAYVLNDQVTEQLVYNRQLILKGEFWRLFTGHFLHTNVYHLCLNLAAVVLLWALHGQYYTKLSYSLLFVFTALTTSVFMYYFSPELLQYVGLSGVLHGIFVWGAIQDIIHKEKTGYWLLIGVFIKLVHEQLSGPSEDMAKLIGANVAIDAHLWGAIAGLVFSLFYIKYSSKSENR